MAILDADKEGFLRSTVSLIQTVGRAARNVNGCAILYADRITDSMRQAIDETARRRGLQKAYNREHGITPETIVKPISMSLARIVDADYTDLTKPGPEDVPEDPREFQAYVSSLERQMRKAAQEFEFEKAARLRDRVRELKGEVPAVAARRK